MAKHIHADLMMKAAEIAKTDDQWWKYFEVFDIVDNEFVSYDRPFTFYDHREYRLKPRTIKIGNIDVPEPVREPLADDTVYYVPVLNSSSEKPAIYRWDGVCFDNVMLERGFVHLDCESAEIHARALISLTQK
ncbi:hypothetical protein Xbed_03513 [Xenorhabdus beddingii]|uniref:Uncharacterized protein n=1 Tax=Xenorhabdus beddingii TaxID=40578 RepID=A0A1Y2SBK2_9GAMM|nr:hypothetical protein [Xenorhabdus beddingii]OTA16041.1 hypothetical protein Xbed_03513 [Xenorhabdus beddingii]